MSKLLYEEETYKIIGCCMNVHKELGAGFLESVYQEALTSEFKENNVVFKAQEKLQVYFKEKPLKKYFVADFLCYDKIIVELKAVTFLHNTMKAQTINYLKTTNYKLGLLINFGEPSLNWKRLINTPT